MTINKIKNNKMNKIISNLIIVLICTTITSCAPTYYYQLVNTKPVSNNLRKTEKAIVYEDNNCTISYNLWAKRGSTKIVFENKTDEDIYLDLGATFFFMNNQAFDLYNGQNKNILKSNNQHQIITIPAKMYKIIGETDVFIFNDIFRDCNLFLKPTKKTINSISFSKADTPYSFGLRIAYYVGNNKTPNMIRNEFFVDRITNYPQQSFIEYYTDDKFCPDEKTKGIRKMKYKYKDVDAFYLEYNPTVIGKDPYGYQYNH